MGEGCKFLGSCVCSCSFLNSFPFPQGNVDVLGVLKPNYQPEADRRLNEKSASFSWYEGRTKNKTIPAWGKVTWC